MSSAPLLQGLLGMRRALCTFMGVGCCPSHISTAVPCVPLCLELRSDHSDQKATTPFQVCVTITSQTSALPPARSFASLRLCI